MTLELNKITGQVDEMGKDLAIGVKRRQKALPALRALRQHFANDQERLRALAESSQGGTTGLEIIVTIDFSSTNSNFSSQILPLYSDYPRAKKYQNPRKWSRIKEASKKYQKSGNHFTRSGVIGVKAAKKKVEIKKIAARKRD